MNRFIFNRLKPLMPDYIELTQIKKEDLVENYVLVLNKNEESIIHYFDDIQWFTMGFMPAGCNIKKGHKDLGYFSIQNHKTTWGLFPIELIKLL
jgi:hypothetical protein